MGHVQGEIGKERLVARLRHEFHRFAKKNVGYVTLIGRGHVAVVIRVIEIVVTPVIGNLADTAGLVVHGLFKTLVLRSVRPFLAQVPLAKMSGAIARISKSLGKGNVLGAHHGPTLAGPPGTGLV